MMKPIGPSATALMFAIAAVAAPIGFLIFAKIARHAHGCASVMVPAVMAIVALALIWYVTGIDPIAFVTGFIKLSLTPDGWVMFAEATVVAAFAAWIATRGQ
jgi:hypothetical protein